MKRSTKPTTTAFGRSLIASRRSTDSLRLRSATAGLSAWMTAFLLALSLNLRAATTYTFQEGVNGYSGTQDTQIRGGTPDRDDGALDELSPDMSDGGGQNHILIRFENIAGNGPGQIPAGSSVLAASLTFYLVNPGTPINLHRMLKDWNESTTWNTFDDFNLDGITPDDVEAAIDMDGTFLAPGPVPYFQKVELNTKTVQDWLDGKSPNRGWAVLPTGSNGVDFPSSEHANVSQRPILTVIVGQPGETLVTEFTAEPIKVTIKVQDGTFSNGQANAVNQGSISLTVDGTKVDATATKEENVTTITHVPATAFASGSTHNVVLTYAESSTPPKTVTYEKSFTTATYPTIPESFAVTGVDTSKPGFNARVHQLPIRRPSGDRNNIWSAEKQLSGELRDPDIDVPFENDADLSLAQNGIFEVSTVINWNQDAPGAAGNFSETSATPIPDEPIPGIPGFNGTNDDIAAEITTFLNLKAGFYRLGVNSDDGFRLTVGPGARDITAMQLGSFNTGRGSADSLVDFAIAKDGIYPFRLAWWEGSGGANLEFFSVDPATGEKILINDASNAKAIKAYRTGPMDFLNSDPDLKRLIAIDDKQMWRYQDTGTDLGTAWRDKGFNDSAWPQGPALLGYESGQRTAPIRTEVASGTLTHYYRTRFNFDGDPAAVRLLLLHVIDDGAVFYLNGTEIHRFNIPAGEVTATTAATSHENEFEGPFEAPGSTLVKGENVLAVEVHQTDIGSSDAVMGVELYVAAAAQQAAPSESTLGISRSGAQVTITWNGGKLQNADAVTGPWTDVANATSPTTVTAAGTKFYRVAQ